MDKEELKEDIMEEIDDVVELTEDEEEQITGGEAGYGNIQFHCKCGCKFLRAKKWAIHLSQRRCSYGYIFYQKEKGKFSKGNFATKGGNIVKVTYNVDRRPGRSGMNVTLHYPNGRKYIWKVTSGGVKQDPTVIMP